MPAVSTLDLHPLSKEETASSCGPTHGEQASSARVESIYRRTHGQPLFTEHLAAQADQGLPLPDLLGDLLDERLRGLSRTRGPSRGPSGSRTDHCRPACWLRRPGSPGIT